MSSEPPLPPTIHASTVVIGGKGVLIRGLPRAGKTTLGQALITLAGQADDAEGADENAATGQLAMWVSDDRTIVENLESGLVARPPATIAGRIADRACGIVSVPHAASAVLVLVVDLDRRNVPSGFGGSTRLLGEVLPMLRLSPVTPANATESARHVLAVLRSATHADA